MYWNAVEYIAALIETLVAPARNWKYTGVSVARLIPGHMHLREIYFISGTYTVKGLAPRYEFLEFRRRMHSTWVRNFDFVKDVRQKPHRATPLRALRVGLVNFVIDERRAARLAQRIDVKLDGVHVKHFEIAPIGRRRAAYMTSGSRPRHFDEEPAADIFSRTNCVRPPRQNVRETRRRTRSIKPKSRKRAAHFTCIAAIPL